MSRIPIVIQQTQQKERDFSNPVFSVYMHAYFIKTEEAVNYSVMAEAAASQFTQNM